MLRERPHRPVILNLCTWLASFHFLHLTALACWIIFVPIAVECSHARLNTLCLRVTAWSLRLFSPNVRGSNWMVSPAHTNQLVGMTLSSGHPESSLVVSLIVPDLIPMRVPPSPLSFLLTALVKAMKSLRSFEVKYEAVLSILIGLKSLSYLTRYEALTLLSKQLQDWFSFNVVGQL